MEKRKKGFYFIGALCWGAAFCAVCGAAVYGALFRYTPQDEEEYRSLLLASNPAQAGDVQQTPYTARQKRYGVKKEFTYVKNGTPLNICLQSREAELVLDRQVEATQVIEEMRGIKIFMQEELFYVLSDGREALLLENGKLLLRNAPPDKAGSWVALGSEAAVPMQIVRYLEAETGSYSYKSDKCSAAEVLVERYLLPGHRLTGSLLQGQLILKGVAESVEFVMAGDDPHLVARRLNASVIMPGRL